MGPILTSSAVINKMSLFPTSKTSIDAEEGRPLLFLKDRDNHDHPAPPPHGYYGTDERQLVVGKPILVPSTVQHELAELIVALFMAEQHHHSHTHPRTNPPLPPEKRFARHRNFYVYQLNQFRHWWKTSRLLVRLSGGYAYCWDGLNWVTMAVWDVMVKRQRKQAFKQYKRMGQGGAIKPFLDIVQPFTRTIRIVLAVARAWEARVDNRLYECGIAEAL